MADVWEYYAATLDADRKANEGELKQAGLDTAKMQNYSANTLVVPLNKLGLDGWELVHMQPVVVGGNGDIAGFAGAGAAGRIWTHSYFCVFKRLKTPR